MTRRLLDCVKHTNLDLAHHRAFWEAVEAKLPAGALASDGELGSIWASAVELPQNLAGTTAEPPWLASALKIIKEFEGCHLEAYTDSVGVDTIGWGTTQLNGRPVKLGDRITQAQADRLLHDDLVTRAKALFALIPVMEKWAPQQQAALLSWCYNVGLGAVKNSTLRRRILAGENAVAVVAAELPRWNRGTNGILPGLARRRAAELALFQSGAATTHEPMTAKLSPTSPFSAKLTPNIRLGEFALDRPERRFIHQYQLDTAAELAAFLERVRRNLGGTPIRITSGYRPPSINRQVGGASGSEHLFDAPGVGAVDFYMEKVDIKAVQSFCDKYWDYSVGLGAQKGFVHLGIRKGRPRLRWPY